MSQTVTGDELRQVMRHVPSPVTVVTAAFEGEVRGITIGSFTSVSLEPPLVSFNVHREARMSELIPAAEQFVVNVLAADQAQLSTRFAIPERSEAEMFSDLPHSLAEDGTPVLDGIVAAMYCSVHSQVRAGDHIVFVAEVREVARKNPSKQPLIYFQSTYRDVGSEVGSNPFSPVNRESIDSP